MPNIAMAVLSGRALVADAFGSFTGMLFLLVLSVILFSFLYIITKSIAVAIPGTSTRKIADLEARMEWLLTELDKRDRLLLSMQDEQKKLSKRQRQQVEQQKRTVVLCLDLYNLCTFLYAQNRKPSLPPIDTFFGGISDSTSQSDYGWHSDGTTPCSGSTSPSTPPSSDDSLEQDRSETSSPSPLPRQGRSVPQMRSESPLPQTPDSPTSGTLLSPIEKTLIRTATGAVSSRAISYGSFFQKSISQANTLAIDIEIDSIVRCFDDADNWSSESPRGPRRKSRMTHRQRLLGA